MSSVLTSTSRLSVGVTRAFQFRRPVGTSVFEAVLLSVNGFKAVGCRQASVCSDNVIAGALFSLKIRLKMPCFLQAGCSVTFPSLPRFMCADKNPAENSSQLITRLFLSCFPSLMGVGKEAGEKRMLDKM